MKITILDTIPGEEDEIIIKCQNLSEDTKSAPEIKTGKHQDRGA